METLTTENAKDGIEITCKQHPEWGTWILRLSQNGWEITNQHGTKMLDEGEFHFWKLA